MGVEGVTGWMLLMLVLRGFPLRLYRKMWVESRLKVSTLRDIDLGLFLRWNYSSAPIGAGYNIEGRFKVIGFYLQGFLEMLPHKKRLEGRSIDVSSYYI